ncbi:MAG: hypothetical protein H6686_06810 [Fibrobacteria bacterium]|nr:hypothetical protein [Fibrobacteria bacterium]
MIRINLLRNQFGSTVGIRPAPSHLDLDFDSQESFAVQGRSRKPLWIALAAGVVVAAGVGAWFALDPMGEETVPPASAHTSTPLPVAKDSAKSVVAPDSTPKPAAVALSKEDSAKLAAQAKKAREDSLKLAKASAAEQKLALEKARKDSIASAKARIADSIAQAKASAAERKLAMEKARKDSIAAAKEAAVREKAAAAQRRQDSLAAVRERAQREKQAAADAAAAKSRAASVTASVPAVRAPAVVAPPLAGGVVNLVLTEAKSAAGKSIVASRFEDLIPTGRIAYQRFAFEQILNKLRQVTPGNGIGFSRVRVLSPGVLVLEGEAQSAAVLADLARGLTAQSLLDTSSSLSSDGRFLLTARLPFSASAVASASLSQDFSKDLQKGLDLASSQGIDFSRPGSARTSDTRPFRRAAWKLSGTGSWEGVSRWMGTLAASGSALGFTALELTAGPDGKIKIAATAIAYGK